MSAVSIGVAGWSYDDWRDTVYRLPARRRQPTLFDDAPHGPSTQAARAARYAEDPLAFLAGYVDMIEINSSFYRVPNPSVAASWADRVANRPGFFFTAKLHRDFTHEGRRDDAELRRFLESLAPLTDAGRLQTILAQFRYDFDDQPSNRDRLRWIRRGIGSFCPVVAEVRHRSWQRAEALDFLRGEGLAVAILDYPAAADSFDLRTAAGGETAYLRLHGRNRQAWFSKEAGRDETYNYDYADEEIDDIAARCREQVVKHLTVVANNHYAGKAVSAAVRLKSALEKRAVPVPPALLETYPDLRRISATEPSPRPHEESP